MKAWASAAGGDGRLNCTPVMEQLMQRLKNLIRNSHGVTAIEYALIAALIAVAIIISTQALGGSINTTFTTVGSKMDQANAAAGP